MILRQNICFLMAPTCHKMWAEGHADHIFNNFGLVHLKCVPVGRQWIPLFLSKLWSIWGMPFGRQGWKNGKIIGFCTMTVCLVTSPLQCSNFYWITKFQPSSSHHILQVLLLIAFDYLRPKNGQKGSCFHVQKHSTECDGRFHSHVMCLKQWQGWSKLCACEYVCVCVCAHACAHACQRIRALHFSLHT